MTVDITSIHRYMQRVTKMSQAKQTDMRLTAAEAIELSNTLALLLTEQIQQHNATTIQSLSSPAKFSIDGGFI